MVKKKQKIPNPFKNNTNEINYNIYEHLEKQINLEFAAHIGMKMLLTEEFIESEEGKAIHEEITAKLKEAQETEEMAKYFDELKTTIDRKHWLPENKKDKSDEEPDLQPA